MPSACSSRRVVIDSDSGSFTPRVLKSKVSRVATRAAPRAAARASETIARALRNSHEIAAGGKVTVTDRPRGVPMHASSAGVKLRLASRAKNMPPPVMIPSSARPV